MNLHVILMSNSESHWEKSSVCSISLSARDCVVSEVGSSWLQALLLFLGQKRKQRSANNGFLIISLLQMWWQLSWLSTAERFGEFISGRSAFYSSSSNNFEVSIALYEILVYLKLALTSSAVHNEMLLDEQQQPEWTGLWTGGQSLLREIRLTVISE